MILYCGHESDKHEFGTLFYISILIMHNLLDFETVIERICKIRVKLKHYNLVLISTHAPTEVAKENFYGSLGKVCDEVPNYYMKAIQGTSTLMLENSPIYIQKVEGTAFTTKPMTLENEW
jgi:hypothetical protein